MIRLKIKEAAQAKGFTQGGLGRAANVDNKTIRRIFRDPYSVIGTDTLDSIALALEVDASELLESEPRLPKLP